MFKKFALITILLTIIFSYCYFRYSAYCHYKEKTLPSYPVPSDGDQCERFSVSENKKIVVCLDSIGNFLSIDGLNSGIYLYDNQGIFDLGLYAQAESFSINPSIFHRIEAKFIDNLCHK